MHKEKKHKSYKEDYMVDMAYPSMEVVTSI